MGSRPEQQNPPEIFYNDREAKKYLSSSRMIDIQTKLSERCLELLAFPDEKPCYLLDIGCGTGLSGDVLSEAGHTWIGLDISRSMLDVARQREVDGDLIQNDVGKGIFCRTGVFDGCISVSAIQWLCNADKSHHNPFRRLLLFFQSLYAALRRGSRAVFQFYPENGAQLDLITSAAMKAGFGGGLVVDYPNSTRAKKYFLCLLAGPPAPGSAPPQALGTEEANSVPYSGHRDNAKWNRKGKKGKQRMTRRERVIANKEKLRRRGKIVRPDTKYTGRSRGPKF